ncbi:substrate-binding periplasmic protein [Spartinivicinus ruber]|uniref:substrate-binding periplasmic protein n=1 Tax=Spartinivicinus ruber TaxID=2683272 RepID=UPI0013D7EB03|nr:transporter substrate-binding domain-containing protein [Spartinivicinus ruber]
MKYKFAQLLLLGIFLTLFKPAFLWACIKEGYVVGYSEFFPFTYTASSGEVVGLDAELVKAVFEQAGCTFDFVNMPWSRMIKGLKHGVPDVVLVASKTTERSMYAYFSLPYRNEQMRFMIRKNEAQRWPIERLQDVIKFKMRTAVVLENWFGKEFAKLKDNKEFKKLIIGVTEDADRFSMLMSYRVDAVLHDKIYLMSMAEKLDKKSEVSFLPFVVNDAPVHFMFSKKTTPQEDLAMINQKLNEFKKTKKYKTLYGEMKSHYHEP